MTELKAAMDARRMEQRKNDEEYMVGWRNRDTMVKEIARLYRVEGLCRCVIKAIWEQSADPRVQSQEKAKFDELTSLLGMVAGEKKERGEAAEIEKESRPIVVPIAPVVEPGKIVGPDGRPLSQAALDATKEARSPLHSDIAEDSTWA